MTSGWPTRRSTRSAIEVADVETASQRPSAVRVDVAWSVRRGTVPGAWLQPAGLVEHAGARSDSAHHRLEQREIDDLPASRATRPVPVPQRHHHRAHPAQSAQRVGQTHRRERRRAVRLAGDRSEARHGLGQGAEARTRPVGTGLAEPRDAHQHEPWVHCVQLVPAEAPPFQGPGPEVLDDHVCLGGQAAAATRRRRAAPGRSRCTACCGPRSSTRCRRRPSARRGCGTSRRGGGVRP